MTKTNNNLETETKNEDFSIKNAIKYLISSPQLYYGIGKMVLAFNIPLSSFGTPRGPTDYLAMYSAFSGMCELISGVFPDFLIYLRSKQKETQFDLFPERTYRDEFLGKMPIELWLPKASFYLAKEIRKECRKSKRKSL